jgi:hypothetical protein
MKNRNKLTQELKEMGLSRQTIECYVDGSWGVPTDILNKLKKKEVQTNEQTD